MGSPDDYIVTEEDAAQDGLSGVAASPDGRLKPPSGAPASLKGKKITGKQKRHKPRCPRCGASEPENAVFLIPPHPALPIESWSTPAMVNAAGPDIDISRWSVCPHDFHGDPYSELIEVMECGCPKGSYHRPPCILR